tara:strand:+ start:290 stop:1039 length:750 start_codon:yes stop_codon:yes gene_type:complete
MLLNIFKSKPTLKELIPKGFVDIHSHVLPGIDDGARNIKESIELILAMKELGYSKIIATPHIYPGVYENDNFTISKSFNSVKNSIGNGLILKYSSEYMIDYNLIEKSENNKLLTIKDRYVLIELGFMNIQHNFHEILYKIQVNKYIPVIAHPERCLYFLNDLKYLYKLKKIGCKFQINLLSIYGYYGPDVFKLCNFLIKNEMVDFIGSDFHSLKHINFLKKENGKFKSIKSKYNKQIEKIVYNTKEKFI